MHSLGTKSRIAFSWLLFSALLFSALLMLTARATAADSTGLVPKVSGPPHAIPSNFFGINIENVYLGPPSLSWTDPALIKAIQAVGIQSVRFPGGDAGNYWDWQQGTMYPLGGSANVQDYLSDLSTLSQSTAVQPVYNLNVMTYNNALIDTASLAAAMSNQIQMLQTAASLGLPVQNLELGNEFFWSGHDHDHEFSSAKNYAEKMNQWVPSLKAVYPKAQFAAVGSIPYPYDSRTRTWNAALLANIKGVNAITLHRYDDIIDGGIYDGTAPDAVLSLAFSDWSQILTGEVRPIEEKHLKIWITEFGGFQDCTSNAQFLGTWLEGLYQTQMAIQFLSRPSIEQMQLYNMTGSTSSLIFQDSSSYWDPCLSKTVTFNATAGDLTATGQAYSLIGNALHGIASASEVIFPEAPIIKPTGGGKHYSSVTGIVLTGTSKQWLLTNYAAQPVTLSYSGMGTGTIESLSSSSLTTVVNAEGVLSHTTSAFDGTSFVLPAFSVNRIVVQ